jgi:hypothetical protein
MLPSIPIFLALALLAEAQYHLPLTRRSRFSKIKSSSDYKGLRDFTIGKYSKAHLGRRQKTENVALTNFGFDTTYYAPATVRGNVSDPDFVIDQETHSFSDVQSHLGHRV